MMVWSILLLKSGLNYLKINNMREFEAKQRLKWFIDGYFIHNLGSLFSKISTERICELYNVELSYFRKEE